jgi:hypothetical protein
MPNPPLTPEQEAAIRQEMQRRMMSPGMAGASRLFDRFVPAGSPLGAASRLPRQATDAALGGLAAGGNWLVTDPATVSGQASTPVASEDLPRYMPPAPDITPKRTFPSGPTAAEAQQVMDMPAPGTAPSAVQGAEPVRGMASYSGPRLNTTEALSGLQAAGGSSSYTPGGGEVPGSRRTIEGPSGGFGVPTTLADVQGGYGNLEEVMRLANAAPGTTAPGAEGYWQRELSEQLEPEDYNRLLERKQQESILGGLTAQHPAIYGAAEAEARRRAMPQAAYGEAQFQGQVAGAQSRLGVEGSRAAQAEKSSKIAYAGQLATALSRLMSSAQGATDEGQAVAAQLQGLLLATLGDLEDVDMSEMEEEQ